MSSISNNIPTLHYFNGRGRGEATRLLLTLAGVEFNDIRHPLPFTDDNEIKQKATYKQLPYYVDGDFEIAQAQAIENYIASKYNLAGDNIFEKARVLSIASSVLDIRTPLFTNDTDEKKLKYKNETLPRFLSAWDKILVDNGGKYFVGSKLSAADVSAYCTLEMLYAFNYKNVVDRYPNLTLFKSKFESIPSISTYQSKRPANPLF
ncbi:putative glutathione S-transferase [Heterostelium album PN500]|uniref:Putative glutathione S-transferase n=1 Tax=Heterostelium pallidum (strain ATCC 26659 / Pp 5 / PN500) TaxID=670386 RepID=D3BMJ1_HETP5|nr:putative glutathione S-transferase [Heterostelium album PN500]EFA77203.1 putative glutathione S-transferase [Heterostelium album PN500]|eukprot:XP_020429332.1 putative glutathione S-transferase [Heterostelium album PN500]